MVAGLHGQAAGRRPIPDVWSGLPGDRRRRGHRRRPIGRRGGQMIVPGDGRDGARRDGVLRDRSGRRRDRHLAARPAQGVRGARRAGRAGMVRAAHPRLRRRRSASTASVFGWDTHVDERHARVPLHHATARATTQLAGIMDASGYLPEGVPCELGRSTSRVEDTDAAVAAGRRARRVGARGSPRTRPTAAWPSSPTPTAPRSASWAPTSAE